MSGLAKTRKRSVPSVEIVSIPPFTNLTPSDTVSTETASSASAPIASTAPTASTASTAPIAITVPLNPIHQDGTFLGSLSNQSSQFQTFLTSHANDAYTRPWHRLERGVRLNRLRLFAHEERGRCALNDTDQQALFLVLTKALDKKQLNSKTIVTYDTEQQKILEIKGLVSHKHADGRTVYQFLERKTGVTSKRKPVDTA